MATKNLIPRGDGEGGIGKPTVAWGSGVFKTGAFESALTISGVPVSTGSSQDSFGADQIDFNSSLIPDTNAVYDLGSAEKKIRHLFLSDNSLHIGGTTISAGDTLGDIQFPSGITVTKDSSINGNLGVSSKVGIGTTSPDNLLHVKRNTTDNTYAIIENTTAGNAGINLKNADGDWKIVANADLRFIDSAAVGAEDRIRIDSNGNVGIGIENPSAKLSIDGDFKIGEARINSENDRIVFDSVPAALDSIGNPQTFLTAEKLGLGTSENLATTSQDVEFKLLTDENRFVVGTTGEGGLASGWYRFNDFQVKGATDIGAHTLNPVDTRIYSDSDSFVYMTRDAYGNRVAHLVGGDEEVSPANNIALGLAVKIDETDTPQDIEFTHTDGEQYSLINGDSDSKGINGIPIRQGFQDTSIGAEIQPLLIDGGYF